MGLAPQTPAARAWHVWYLRDGQGSSEGRRPDAIGRWAMWNEFKKFALQGNAIDLAVGVIIGAAFGRIVSSLVDDVLMPPLGLLTGGLDFSNWFMALGGDKHYHTLAEAKAAGVSTLNVGLFLNAIIQFLIVAVAVFLVIVKPMNRLRKAESAADAKAPGAPPEPSAEEKLLIQIRDLLKARA